MPVSAAVDKIALPNELFISWKRIGALQTFTAKLIVKYISGPMEIFMPEEVYGALTGR